MTTTTIIVAQAEQSLIRIGAVPAWAAHTITISTPGQPVEQHHVEAAASLQQVVQQWVTAYERGWGHQVVVEHANGAVFS